tara:strand:- start:340 stop:663 length:324 start_codon:yes stop_codon:yes gene_type:complete
MSQYNQKKIEGAGKYGGYRGDILSANQAEKVARGMSGGRIGAGAITFEGYRDHIPAGKKPGMLKQKNIKRKSKMKTPKAQKVQRDMNAKFKTWQDRNVNNRGSKLNP